MRVVFAREHFAEDGQTRGHREAIGVVRAAVKDLVLDDQIHHFPAGAEGRKRNTAADGFRQGDHVRLHAKVFAGAAPTEFRASFHFVENQQRAIFGADVAQALEKTGLRHAEADVHHNRFDDDRGDLTGKLFEAIFDAARDC